MEPKVIEQIVAIPLNKLIANQASNCRKKIDPITVVNLWKSIEKEGLLQPVVVRPVGHGYELICGFRRWQAHIVGKAEYIPAKIITCSDQEAQVFNLVENLERQNLNLLEEAESVQKLKFLGWTQDRIAKRFNVSRVWVIGREHLLALPEAIQQEAAAGILKMGHIDALYKMTSVEEQFETVKKLKDAARSGEKITAKALQPKVPNHEAPKKARTKNEMIDMIQIIMQKVGPCLASRTAAWCAGEISTDDLIKDAEKEGLVG